MDHFCILIRELRQKKLVQQMCLVAPLSTTLHCSLTRRDVMVDVRVCPLRPAHPGDVPNADGGVGDCVAGRGVADHALHAAVGLGERTKILFFYCMNSKITDKYQKGYPSVKNYSMATNVRP